MTTQVALMIMLAMIGISILMILIFGFKNLINGKHEVQKIITMIVPFALFGVTYAVMGEGAAAAMATMMIMIGLLALFILVSGLRSTFNF
jgi:hypothetical protein